LRRGVPKLLDVAEIVVLDAAILSHAGTMQTSLAMSGQDAIVLASVLRHLRLTAPPESCFLNRNSRDFDDPDVRELLGQLRCKYFGRFDSGLPHILANLRRSPGSNR